MVLAWVACGLAGVSTAADAPAKNKIQALLITGDDVAPFHQWREISEATREAIVASGRIEVKVCEDPLILESAVALKGYDVIVFTLFNRSVPMITPSAQENLLDFVKQTNCPVVDEPAAVGRLPRLTRNGRCVPDERGSLLAMRRSMPYPLAGSRLGRFA
jgi:hypothetical protein